MKKFEKFSKSQVKEKFGQVGGAGLASLVTDECFNFQKLKIFSKSKILMTSDQVGGAGLAGLGAD